MCLQMTFANNLTTKLWQSFMPRRHEITNAANQLLYSIQIYPETFDFNHFDFNRPFEKRAAVEVADFSKVPEGMKAFVLPGGWYALFLHAGAPQEGERTFRYIFEEWLPQSGFVLDPARPHFEVLGKKYKNNAPDSEEEIWIPIKKQV